MVEKNLKKLKAKKRRVMNGFNTGTRDMKLKTAYQRKKRWSAKMPTIILVLQFKRLRVDSNHRCVSAHLLSGEAP